ncbi:MAG: DUF1294 domain-containing protein [Solobacterium sp.]|nr:DUF1294 domain-containing protein [Solobacterium sp.]
MRSLYLFWLAAVNILAFLLYGADKRKAKKNLWRIPESSLLAAAAAGGAFGAFFGMTVFRHKTKKPVFRIVTALSMIAWTLVTVFVFLKAV